jgi:hypothetical protein
MQPIEAYPQTLFEGHHYTQHNDNKFDTHHIHNQVNNKNVSLSITILHTYAGCYLCRVVIFRVVASLKGLNGIKGATTFSITKLSIMTFRIITSSIMTLSIMTLSIMTLGLYVTLSIMLSDVMLNVVFYL